MHTVKKNPITGMRGTFKDLSDGSQTFKNITDKSRIFIYIAAS